MNVILYLCKPQLGGLLFFKWYGLRRQDSSVNSTAPEPRGGESLIRNSMDSKLPWFTLAKWFQTTQICWTVVPQDNWDWNSLQPQRHDRHTMRWECHRCPDFNTQNKSREGRERLSKETSAKPRRRLRARRRGRKRLTVQEEGFFFMHATLLKTDAMSTWMCFTVKLSVIAKVDSVFLCRLVQRRRLELSEVVKHTDVWFQ